MLLQRGSSRSVFYSRWAAEGCPPKASHADGSESSAVWQQSRCGAPQRRDRIHPASCCSCGFAEQSSLAQQDGDEATERPYGPARTRHVLVKAPGWMPGADASSVPTYDGHSLGVKKIQQSNHPANEEPQGPRYAAASTVQRALLQRPGKGCEPQAPAQGCSLLSAAAGSGANETPLQPKGHGWAVGASPPCCSTPCVSAWLTLCYHLAEDRQRVQRGAVPAAVAELVLALLNGQLGSTPHRVHHLQVPLAHLHLALDQALQLLTGLLLRDAPHRRQLCQVPAATASATG